jgi:hypothetical protein
MKVILSVKTDKGLKSSKKEKDAAISLLQRINESITEHLEDFNSGKGIPYKDGAKWIWSK